MGKIDQIIKKIFASIDSPQQGSENFAHFEAKVIGNLQQSIDPIGLGSELSSLMDGEVISLSLAAFDNAIVFENGCQQLSVFCDEVHELFAPYGTDLAVTLTVRIVKPSANSRIIPIHRLDWFQNYVMSQSIMDLLSTFSKYFGGIGLQFYLHDHPDFRFESTSISFCGEAVEQPKKQEWRVERRNSIKSQCHFENSAYVNLIPDDFYFQVKFPQEFSEIGIRLHLLCEALTLASLLDISKIVDGALEYKLNGYKARTGKHYLGNEEFFKSFDTYFRIYQWIYEGGSLADKIGVSRNILSLHFISADSMELEGDPFHAIISGFNIYQKQNVKQYIEIRNKVMEQLVDLTGKAAKISEGFIANFQKSTFSFLSFFTSVLLLRLLGKGAEGPVFSTTTFVLTMVFLALSLVYLFLTSWEFNTELIRLNSNYTSMKRRFLDLLNQSDIDRILGYDSEFNEAKTQVLMKRKMYRGFWLLMILGFLVASGVLWMISI
jgi:hypothetical protein